MKLTRRVTRKIGFPRERKINQYKSFFKLYLKRIKNVNRILKDLKALVDESTSSYPEHPASVLRLKEDDIRVRIPVFLEKHFPEEVLKQYDKPVKVKYQTPDHLRGDINDNILVSLFKGFGVIGDQFSKEYVAEANYKKNFLTFLYSCLYYRGLHPEIEKRENHDKRYNVLLHHYFRCKDGCEELKILLSNDELEKEILTPYLNEMPILINGKLIKPKDLHFIKITTTLLKDDEIELFTNKNGIIWKPTSIDSCKSFFDLCKDETNILVQNPYLVKLEEIQEINERRTKQFINQLRIEELKSIKSQKFDLKKLIKLCEELNNNASLENWHSVSSNSRSIIDHVPPIFGFKNFNQVANNYSGGGRSLKKNFLNLQNSLRNISDSHLHTQVRKSESLPNENQVDFSRELDLLLGEIVRILSK